jgi:hypothetical protein
LQLRSTKACSRTFLFKKIKRSLHEKLPFLSKSWKYYKTRHPAPVLLTIVFSDSLGSASRFGRGRVQSRSDIFLCLPPSCACMDSHESRHCQQAPLKIRSLHLRVVYVNSFLVLRPVHYTKEIPYIFGQLLKISAYSPEVYRRLHNMQYP